MRAAGAASSTTPPVPPQPVDTGRARVADLSAVETVPGTSGASTDVTIQARKVQLKTTVDQNAEAEVDLMDDLSQETCYRNYRAVMKGMPRPEIEPGLDQLTALLALIVAGLPPYVDLAIWGNSEFRDEVRPKLEGLRPQHDGTWTSARIHGPDGYAQWECTPPWRSTWP